MQLLRLLEQLCGEWKYLVGIAKQAQVGQCEDGRTAVGVDGDHRLCFAHAAGVLRGSGDATGDVEPGVYDFARGADLPGMFNPAKIGCYTRRPYCGIEKAREGGNGGKSFLPNATSPCNDALGSIQFNLLRRWRLYGDTAYALMAGTLLNYGYEACEFQALHPLG